MKRKIKFKGKRVDNEEWIYGYYWFNDMTSKHCIDLKNVVPETVGQFTGCLDKNGVEIYEGDIVQNEYYRVEIEDCTDLSIESEKEKVVVKFKVVWYEAGFVLLDIDQNVLAEPMYSNFISRAQVIGNIHENK